MRRDVLEALRHHEQAKAKIEEGLDFSNRFYFSGSEGLKAGHVAMGAPAAAGVNGSNATAYVSDTVFNPGASMNIFYLVGFLLMLIV